MREGILAAAAATAVALDLKPPASSSLVAAANWALDQRDSNPMVAVAAAAAKALAGKGGDKAPAARVRRAAEATAAAYGVPVTPTFVEASLSAFERAP